MSQMRYGNQAEMGTMYTGWALVVEVREMEDRVRIRVSGKEEEMAE